MARRSVSWEKILSAKLKDLEFARYFILALINDEGLGLKEALRETIEAYGYTEYAEVCGIKQPNLYQALSNDSNPTVETLEKILAPLRLNITAKVDLAS